MGPRNPATPRAVVLPQGTGDTTVHKSKASNILKALSETWTKTWLGQVPHVPGSSINQFISQLCYHSRIEGLKPMLLRVIRQILSFHSTHYCFCYEWTKNHAEVDRSSLDRSEAWSLGVRSWEETWEREKGKEREPAHVTSRSQACRWTDCGADASLYQTQLLHRQGKWLGPVMTSTGQEADKRRERKKKERRIWDQIHKEWTLKAGHYCDDNGMHGRSTHKHRWQKVESPEKALVKVL